MARQAAYVGAADRVACYAHRLIGDARRNQHARQRMGRA